MSLSALLQPSRILLLTTLVSVTALAIAFTSEALLGLEPCPLCIMQRWPYAIAALLGVLGLALQSRHGHILGSCLVACAAAFFVNTGIAFYHTGVEQHWWISAVEGCAVPHFSDEPQSILQNIMSAPTGRCDEIPWADPVFGFSMANYNVVLCFALFALCAYGAKKALLAKH